MSPAGRDLFHTLAVDRGTGIVVAALREAGVTAVLLKGPTLAAWTPTAASPRTYVDTDLLVAPSNADRARGVLRRLGYQQLLQIGEAPGRADRAMAWRDSDGECTVDLHTALEGAEAAPARQWEELSTSLEEMLIGGTTVHCLDPTGRALLVALHAAQHGPDFPKPLTDLENALAATELALWRRADLLAARLGARGAFAAGLRLVPAGAAVADALALPHTMPTVTALRVTGAAPLTMGIEEWAQLRGWRARARRLRRELAPSAAFMRLWWPQAKRGPFWLALAYVRRPFWLLARLGPALVSWRRVRRRRD
jgi:hypothetical protein